ncbi:hypothetical protein TGME49_318575 [Toxoplasma gondii ME49]|uniref:Uncharacterized protein n=13 Tax=Toxoplasma gondii TaxID=5811 RepID=A0A125YK77_TOXGV|nr:hypothetical protein TGME49_318575 [Toxoplasma gondii ME49]EPR58189.1 hypothetical protein TGGT1_318575 [Toxoplasma gondii GT1]ESS29727.1 hypothetical protein TGVEG_318575 [Toxoplasma gondii VEG]KAF4644981.1 hypothetical protein TGRH88_007970 [Toxoplasma gondii]KFG31049.1 hypothetical protein TGDOM2_318575 [Toxoplasma gondii GAB2-2007-GAL-DOM2]KFG36213.1 hypothetical protein TGFOU_318575 [Toxoplasma gondii FOU]KFG43565.1 hypothetical protein TGP89_318575 [Toxoplasma gondii p89]KFG57116.1 |eukprot:XP_018638006.1 hypothetical protein TGME49_318575 [Toxoplasma gondii ME49]
MELPSNRACVSARPALSYVDSGQTPSTALRDTSMYRNMMAMSYASRANASRVRFSPTQTMFCAKTRCKSEENDCCSTTPSMSRRRWTARLSIKRPGTPVHDAYLKMVHKL